MNTPTLDKADVSKAFASTTGAEVRVLFVHRWGAIMAGGEIWLKTLAGCLATQGVAVLAALHIRGPLYAALAEMGIDVRATPLTFLRASPRWALLTSGAGLVRSALRLRDVIRATGAQVVHSFSPESAEVALLAARLAGVPHVVTVQNCGPYPRVDQHVLRRSDRVIAISSAVESDLLAAGVAARRIARIPPGIVFDDAIQHEAGALRRELGLPPEAPLVGMVATLEPKKAQDVLLRAVPMVLAAFPAAHFALVGGSHSPGDALTGSYEGDLRRLARSLGVAERVHFLGFRPRAAALLPDLDVSVLCSRHEALGLAAVESMAAGVPLAATAVEGLLEVVEDGVTGLLVPPDDPSSLARSINALLGNRTLAATLAANGRREARARFDANHLAALNRKVYEELLQNKHRH